MVGVDGGRRDTCEVEIKLLSDQLQKRGAVALSELDLAEVDRRCVVAAKRDPRIDELRIAPPRRCKGSTGDGSIKGGTEGKANNQSTHAFECTSARDRHGGVRAHFFISVAARRIAFMIRG